MISLDQLENLVEGTKVAYGIYGNVEFVEVTNINENGKPHSQPHVVMRDRAGNQQRVFMNMFMKYGNIK